MIDPNNYAIAADIGGTNARFSLVNLHTLNSDNFTIYQCSDFANLYDVFSRYIKEFKLEHIKNAAIAIACPVTGDAVSMTNLHWQFSISQLKEHLNLQNLQVLNDFTATAMSLPAISEKEIIRVGNGQVDLKKPRLVIGAGTGLGVAYLIPTDQGFIPLPSEAGHGDWAISNEFEWFIFCYLQNKYGHVSFERVVSGPGLENLYQAIAVYMGQAVKPLNAADIAAQALSGQCSIASAAVKQFFASLGAFAGNLALTMNTFGGVFIAGGIVPKLLNLINSSEFRNCFVEKGRFSLFNNQIGTFVVAAEQPGILGAAIYLKQMLTRDHYVSC